MTPILRHNERIFETRTNLPDSGRTVGYLEVGAAGPGTANCVCSWTPRQSGIRRNVEVRCGRGICNSALVRSLSQVGQTHYIGRTAPSVVLGQYLLGTLLELT